MPCYFVSSPWFWRCWVLSLNYMNYEAKAPDFEYPSGEPMFPAGLCWHVYRGSKYDQLYIDEIYRILRWSTIFKWSNWSTFSGCSCFAVMIPCCQSTSTHVNPISQRTWDIMEWSSGSKGYSFGSRVIQVSPTMAVNLDDLVRRLLHLKAPKAIQSKNMVFNLI